MNFVRAGARPLVHTLALLACAALAACGGGGGGGSAGGEPAAVVALGLNPSAPVAAAPPTAALGLTGRLVVGYQGWFGCPNDLEGNPSWQHWFNGAASTERLTVDALPSLLGMDAADLCDTGMPRVGGGTVRVFSSQRLGVVDTHFRWMKEQGIDGAAVQRFVLEFPDAARLRRTDNVLAHVRAAAEGNGRIFYVSYDVSGAEAATVVDAIRKDWRRIAVDLKVTDSSAYLRDGGKPVVQLWGFGFTDRPGEPGEVAQLISDLKAGAAGLPAATVVGGVPSAWRTLGADSKAAPAWAAVYRSYDVISPWTVGRFADDASVDSFVKTVVEPDLAETRRLGLRYQPVIFPGFSWHNLMANQARPQSAAVNAIPRRCGNFMWRQVWSLLNARADMMYAAMFDEVDEGTALFPLETAADQLPVGAPMLYLNQDGCSLPADWYLRVTGKASGYVRSGTVPSASLADVIQP